MAVKALGLTIQPDVIERARAVATSEGISLSSLTTRLYNQAWAQHQLEQGKLKRAATGGRRHLDPAEKEANRLAREKEIRAKKREAEWAEWWRANGPHDIAMSFDVIERYMKEGTPLRAEGAVTRVEYDMLNPNNGIVTYPGHKHYWPEALAKRYPDLKILEPDGTYTWATPRNASDTTP